MSKIEKAFWMLFVVVPYACIIIVVIALIVSVVTAPGSFQPVKPTEAKVQFDDAAMKGWIDANLSEALERRGLHVYCVLKYTNVGDVVVINRGTDLIIASSREEAECLFNEGAKK